MFATRLQYAAYKVAHGITPQTLSQVEATLDEAAGWAQVAAQQHQRTLLRDTSTKANIKGQGKERQDSLQDPGRSGNVDGATQGEQRLGLPSRVEGASSAPPRGVLYQYSTGSNVPSTALGKRTTSDFAHQSVPGGAAASASTSTAFDQLDIASSAHPKVKRPRVVKARAPPLDPPAPLIALTPALTLVTAPPRASTSKHPHVYHPTPTTTTPSETPPLTTPMLSSSTYESFWSALASGSPTPLYEAGGEGRPLRGSQSPVRSGGGNLGSPVRTKSPYIPLALLGTQSPSYSMVPAFSTTAVANTSTGLAAPGKEWRIGAIHSPFPMLPNPTSHTRSRSRSPRTSLRAEASFSALPPPPPLPFPDLDFDDLHRMGRHRSEEQDLHVHIVRGASDTAR